MVSARRLAVRLLPAPARALLERRYYARAVRLFWEPDVVPLERLVAPGDVVVDAGANLGWYTNVLSRRVGPQGRVVAVEPVPHTVELLRAVVRQLELANVRVEGCALSDREATLAMELPKDAGGNTSHYLARVTTGAGGELERFLVPARTLDELLGPEERERCTFVKCDVEGHELPALRGARELLARAKPALLVELSGAAPERHALRRYLQELCYAPWWYDGRKVRPFVPGDRPVNLLFLQPAHVERLAPLHEGAAA